VPGNLNELIGAAGMMNVLPEVNALQSAMRQRSGGFIREAERGGHSEDVCSYVKCDIGMLPRATSGRRATPSRRPTCCCCRSPAASRS
jgi:benzoyl-CoA reductase subunit B